MLDAGTKGAWKKTSKWMRKKASMEKQEDEEMDDVECSYHEDT